MEWDSASDSMNQWSQFGAKDIIAWIRYNEVLIHIVWPIAHRIIRPSGQLLILINITLMIFIEAVWNAAYKRHGFLWAFDLLQKCKTYFIVSLMMSNFFYHIMCEVDHSERYKKITFQQLNRITYCWSYFPNKGSLYTFVWAELGLKICCSMSPAWCTSLWCWGMAEECHTWSDHWSNMVINQIISGHLSNIIMENKSQNGHILFWKSAFYFFDC